MIRKQDAVPAALGIALVFALGCTARNNQPSPSQGRAPHGQQDKRKFVVYIYSDPAYPGQCFIDWPVATLWKTHHQTVTWVSDDGNQYTIDFGQGSHTPPPKNPFQGGDPQGSNTFSVPAGSSGRNSDKLLDAASGYYDFAILGPNGQVCKKPTDPDPGYYVK